MAFSDAQPIGLFPRRRKSGGPTAAGQTSAAQASADQRVADRPRELAAWWGLGSAAALLLVAMALGGSLLAYLDLPAFLIVFGGSAAVTAVSFPFEDLRGLPAVLRASLRNPPASPRAHALRLIELAAEARVSGSLILEDRLPRLIDDPYLLRAVALVIDNTSYPEIERQMRNELQARLGRLRASADLLRRAGEVAPAMGLIGTLIGLVRMLASLDNPAALGPAMAVAILATLYGAILANVVLLPFAAKLDRNAHRDALIGNLTGLAIRSIATQDSPRRLEAVMNGILPPAQQLDLFD